MGVLSEMELAGRTRTVPMGRWSVLVKTVGDAPRRVASLGHWELAIACMVEAARRSAGGWAFIHDELCPDVAAVAECDGCLVRVQYGARYSDAGPTFLPHD